MIYENTELLPSWIVSKFFVQILWKILFLLRYNGSSFSCSELHLSVFRYNDAFNSVFFKGTTCEDLL